MTTIKISRGYDTTYDVLLKSGGVYAVDANIDMNGFDINEIDDLTFGTGQDILTNTSGMLFDLPTGDTFQWYVNSVSQMVLDDTKLDLEGNDLQDVANIVGTSNQATISDFAGGWLFDVDVGDGYDFYINGSGEYNMDATGLDLLGNQLEGINKLIGSTTTNIIDDLTSGWSYEVDTGDLHQFKVAGTVEMTIEGGVVDIKNNYLQIAENSAPTGTANNARVFAVDNGSGKTVLKVIFGSGAAQTLATEP